MKRILALVVCLVLVAFSFVGCAELPIGSYRDNYDYTPDNQEELKLNMYIVGDALTASNAAETVKQNIDQYTKKNFNISLNVVFVTSADYASVVVDALNSTNPDTLKPDIFLVNSEEMMATLATQLLVADLTDYYNTEAFGTLNVQINHSLLKASRLSDRLYTVPNNNVVGSYEYIAINKSVARNYYISDEILATYTTQESYMAEGQLGYLLEEDGLTVSDYIKVITDGKYEDKALLESQNYYCNISKYPMASSADAFSSAFAISKATADVGRAMQVIYAINTDASFRNLLQYGVEGTHYNLDGNGNVVRVATGDSVYRMNIKYTGDAFKALPCSEIGWTPEVIENGKRQNAQTVE